MLIELFTGLMSYNLMCLLYRLLLQTVQIVFNTQLTICTVSLDLLLCSVFFFYCIYFIASFLLLLLYFYLVLDCCSVFVWYVRFNSKSLGIFILWLCTFWLICVLCLIDENKTELNWTEYQVKKSSKNRVLAKYTASTRFSTQFCGS